MRVHFNVCCLFFLLFARYVWSACYPCENGSICPADAPVGLNPCDCTGTGFTGVSCDVDLDDCASSPCGDGTCVDVGGNMYECTCPGVDEDYKSPCGCIDLDENDIADCDADWGEIEVWFDAGDGLATFGEDVEILIEIEYFGPHVVDDYTVTVLVTGEIEVLEEETDNEPLQDLSLADGFTEFSRFVTVPEGLTALSVATIKLRVSWTAFDGTRLTSETEELSLLLLPTQFEDSVKDAVGTTPPEDPVQVQIESCTLTEGTIVEDLALCPPPDESFEDCDLRTAEVTVTCVVLDLYEDRPEEASNGLLLTALGLIFPFSGALMPFPVWGLFGHMQRLSHLTLLPTDWPDMYDAYLGSFLWTTLRIPSPWDTAADSDYTVGVASAVDIRPENLLLTQLFWTAVIVIVMRIAELIVTFMFPEVPFLRMGARVVQVRTCVAMFAPLLTGAFFSVRLVFEDGTVMHILVMLLGLIVIGLGTGLLVSLYRSHYWVAFRDQTDFTDPDKNFVYGFAFAGFQPDRRWWSLYTLAMSFGEALIIGLIPNTVVSAVLLSLWSLAALIVLLVKRPYIYISHLLLSGWIHLHTLLVYVAVLLLELNALDEYKWIPIEMYHHEATLWGWIVLAFAICSINLTSLYNALYPETLRNTLPLLEMRNRVVLRGPRLPSVDFVFRVPNAESNKIAAGRSKLGSKAPSGNAVAPEGHFYEDDAKGMGAAKLLAAEGASETSDAEPVVLSDRVYFDMYRFRNMLLVGCLVELVQDADKVEEQRLLEERLANREREMLPMGHVPIQEFVVEVDEEKEAEEARQKAEEKAAMAEAAAKLKKKVRMTRRKIGFLCMQLDIDSEGKLLEEDEDAGADLDHILQRLEVSLTELRGAESFMKTEVKRLQKNVERLCLRLGEDSTDPKYSLPKEYSSLPSQLSLMREAQASLDALTRTRRKDMSKLIDDVKLAWELAGDKDAEIGPRATALELSCGIDVAGLAKCRDEIKAAEHLKETRRAEIAECDAHIRELRELCNASSVRSLDECFVEVRGGVREHFGYFPPDDMLVSQEHGQSIMEYPPRPSLLAGMSVYLAKLNDLIDEFHGTITTMWARVDPMWVALRLDTGDLTDTHKRINALPLRAQVEALKKVLQDLDAKEQLLSGKAKEIRDMVQQVMALHARLLIKETWQSLMPEFDKSDSSEEGLERQIEAYKEAMRALKEIEEKNLAMIKERSDVVLESHSLLLSVIAHVPADEDIPTGDEQDALPMVPENVMDSLVVDLTAENPHEVSTTEAKMIHYSTKLNFGRMSVDKEEVVLNKLANTLGPNSLGELKKASTRVELPPVMATVTALEDLNTKYKSAINQVRHVQIARYMIKIESMWSLLGSSKADRALFDIAPLQPSEIVTKDRVARYRDEVERLEALAMAKLREVVPLYLSRLEKLWKELDMKDERKEFHTKYYKEEMLYNTDVFQEMQELYSLLSAQKVIIKKVQERRKFIEKIKEFETTAGDASRLFRSSKQLLAEDKFRKTCYPDLRKKDAEVLKVLREHFAEFHEVFYFPRSVDTLAEIEKEIASRPVNIEISGLLGLMGEAEYAAPRKSSLESSWISTTDKEQSAKLLTTSTSGLSHTSLASSILGGHSQKTKLAPLKKRKK